MEIFAVVIFIVFCSALCHLVHAFYNRSSPFLLSLLAAICKIYLLKFYDLKLKGSRKYKQLGALPKGLSSHQLITFHP